LPKRLQEWTQNALPEQGDLLVPFFAPGERRLVVSSSGTQPLPLRAKTVFVLATAPTTLYWSDCAPDNAAPKRWPSRAPRRRSSASAPAIVCASGCSCGDLAARPSYRVYDVYHNWMERDRRVVRVVARCEHEAMRLYPAFVNESRLVGPSEGANESVVVMDIERATKKDFVACLKAANRAGFFS